MLFDEYECDINSYIMMCKVVMEVMLNYVEVKKIQVWLWLMINKVFYMGLSLMTTVMILVKVMVMMTMLVILMINKILHDLWMFEVISIYML